MLKQQQRNGSALGMTGREALLMTEPDDDMTCSDLECCKERKSAGPLGFTTGLDK